MSRHRAGDVNGGYGSLGNAIVTAVRNTLRGKPALDSVPASVRIDGKVCLVTGANRGLGRAVAVDLARRGGRVLMACRSGHPEAEDDVKQASGSDTVEMLTVDLADMRSVHRLCDELKERNIGIDIAVLNAGLAALGARRTPQGFETMFAVHFLANRVMVDRWLKDGLLRPSNVPGSTPRIVFVASETHRSAEPIDFEALGAYNDFRGAANGLKQYCSTKLHMCTYAKELSRRLDPADNEAVPVFVHTLCPGAIASGIAREAPAILRPIVQPVMRLLFQGPEKAARPVIYLCCADEAGARTGMYLHMMVEKEMSALATDETNGAKLWEASQVLVEKHAAPADDAPEGG
ncbi:MAG: SDR family NAD(P)-dependent oxidoreductase [Gammaproteobacteria bacterium]|nr:SDR family NAD(P)-dependent oxidoreductase [Gammaproteobacteria bacterium]